MKKIPLLLFLIVLFLSCEPSHKDASALCECYTELHRAVPLKKVEIIGDSCSNLYVEILERLKGDEKEMKLFEQALNSCQ